MGLLLNDQMDEEKSLFLSHRSKQDTKEEGDRKNDEAGEQKKKTGETHIRSALKREKKPDRYVVCREQTCKTRENNGMDLLSYIFFPLSSTYDRQVKKHNKEEGMMTALYSSRGGYFFLIPCKIQEKEAASALSFIPSSSSPCSWRCIHLLVPWWSPRAFFYILPAQIEKRDFHQDFVWLSWWSLFSLSLSLSSWELVLDFLLPSLVLMIRIRSNDRMKKRFSC